MLFRSTKLSTKLSVGLFALAVTTMALSVSSSPVRADDSEDPNAPRENTRQYGAFPAQGGWNQGNRNNCGNGQDCGRGNAERERNQNRYFGNGREGGNRDRGGRDGGGDD